MQNKLNTETKSTCIYGQDILKKELEFVEDIAKKITISTLEFYYNVFYQTCQPWQSILSTTFVVCLLLAANCMLSACIRVYVPTRNVRYLLFTDIRYSDIDRTLNFWFWHRLILIKWGSDGLVVKEVICFFTCTPNMLIQQHTTHFTTTRLLCVFLLQSCFS